MAIGSARSLLANALLVAVVALLAAGTIVQVRHNAATGPHGHAPHQRPVAARVVHVR